MPREFEDEVRDAPPPVVGAVAAGVAPLPFLLVYAVLFIAHGTVSPVVPYDVGNSKGDVLTAGLVALALFVIGALALFWFLDARRRWLFVLFQAATLGTAVDFIVDRTTGSPAIPILLAITGAIALALSFLPASGAHLRQGEHAEARSERRAASRERATAENTDL